MSLYSRIVPRVTINLSSIRSNYKLLESKLSNSVLASVLKANAYGLGIERVALTLSKAGCNIFFVATLDEGIELRQILPKATIYIFHGFFSESYGDYRKYKLKPILNSIEQIRDWLPYSDIMAGVQFDTGMLRLGLKPKDIENLRDKEKKNIELLMSHLACADDKNDKKNLKQLKNFNNAIIGFKAKYNSLAASSGIFLGRNYHHNLCRTGAALFGINPTPYEPNHMQSSISLQTGILQIRQVNNRETVGYGGTYQVSRATKIATIAIGYADGFLRSLGNKGSVFINQYKAPIIGRISMDLTTIDVTDVPDQFLYSGNCVDLIGPNYDLDEIAKDAGTIGYEILTSLGSRVKRHYIDNEEKNIRLFKDR